MNNEARIINYGKNKSYRFLSLPEFSVLFLIHNSKLIIHMYPCVKRHTRTTI